MELSIRDLYFKIIEFEGDKLYESVLQNWVYKNEYQLYLSSLSNNLLVKKHQLLQEDIWELYALSRVLDILTLRFQPNNNADGSNWAGPNLSSFEYNKFCELIGLQTSIPKSFHDFDCEILEAKSGENNFQIDECFFPAVKLKNLVIKRAGLRIFLNDQNFDINLVNNSKIYWASRRNNRRYHDLSIGWGSNSQWRTDFRLDIETEESFIYNYNGKLNLNDSKIKDINQFDNDLTIEEAIELTKTRHFIRSKKEDSDLFPYEFRYDERKTVVKQ